MVIGLFPDWFASVQPDWPRNLHLAGFVLHDDSERQPVSAEVQQFLNEGPPPVIFTPGSAAATLRDFFRESVGACLIGGYRAMLVTRYPEQLPNDLPSGVRHFFYLPFSQILPHCAALVYPGGIGTMAQAIKASIPQLVVPHGHDQPDNAYRVKRLGVGQSIYPERYKAKRVARLLRQLLASSEVHGCCAAYANRINSAEALKMSCDLIENLGQSRRRTKAQSGSAGSNAG
jgi:UDP:flavonoid glycosyltransferase YjiC (YdhE family)